jgi:hypothetical protein
MLVSVFTLGDIITQDQMDRFKEALEKMNPDIVRFVDKMTNGRYSKAKKEIDSLTSEIESMNSENSHLKISLAVVNLFHDGKNPKEISEMKKLELEEVVRILRENGKQI